MLALAIAASGCTPAAPPVPVAPKAATASQLANVAAGARRCWFGRRKEFGPYALIDERDSRDQRLLVVDRADPQGRPKLVVELNDANRLQVYGPLATRRNVNEAAQFARTGARRCL